MQEKIVENLVINKIESQAVYDAMEAAGKINSNELYLVGGDGEGVTGVKGAKESAYRTGEVNLTAANVGALPDTTYIPSKTSDLTNDSDFATNGGVDGKLEDKVDKVSGKALSTNDLTNTLKANYDAAYMHSQSAHAPSNAERNTIVSVKKNGTVVSPDSSRAVNITVPTKVSELTNDSGYLTSHQSLADYAKKADVTANADAIATLNGNSSVAGSVDQKVSDAINDFSAKVSEDGTVNTFKELVDYVAEHGSEYTAAIADIAANKAAIDTLNGTGAGSVSKAVSDAQTTLQGNIDKKVDKASGKGLSTNDLTAALKSNYDTAYTHSQSAHAPSNAERNTIVGIQKNGSDVSINSSTRKVNITVPTKVSELTNDSGFLTSVPVTSVNNKTGVVKLTASDIGAAATSHTHPYLPLTGGTVTGAIKYPNAENIYNTDGNILDAEFLLLDSNNQITKASKNDTNLIDAMGVAAKKHTHTKSQIIDFPSSITPSAHKASHKTGGSDALSPADIGAATANHTHDTYTEAEI